MAFDMVTWKRTEASWARGDEADIAASQAVKSSAGKAPWMPVVAVVGVLGLMWWLPKRRLEKLKSEDSDEIRIGERVEREVDPETTTQLPRESMRKMVYGSD